MKKLSSTFKIGLALFMAMFSSNLLPVATAYAATPSGTTGLNNHVPVTICHRTNSVTNPYIVETVDEDSVDGNAGNDNGQGDHYLEHTGGVFDSNTIYPTPHNGDQWGDIIPPIAGVHTGLNWNTAGQAIYDNRCNVPTVSTATPLAPSVNDSCGTVNDSYVLPTDTAKITYAGTKVGNVLTVTATPASGFTLVAGNGYTLNNDSTATLTYTFTHEQCMVAPCTVSAGTADVTTEAQFADYNDTRSKGHFEFTPDGLHIWTEDTSSQSKVAWYHNVTPYSLSQIGEPSISYTSTSGIKPGMQIALDKDGNGTPDGILVGEPDFYGNNWWSNANFGISAGMGYTSYGTLSDYLTANPNAKVMAVGFSLGSGVLAEGVLHSVTFGCFTWTFTADEVREDIPVAPNEPTFTEPTCEVTYGRVTIPSVTGVTYKVNGDVKAAGTYNYPAGSTVTVSVEADSGYVLDGDYGDSVHTFAAAPTDCGHVLGDTTTKPPVDQGKVLGATLPATLPATGETNVLMNGIFMVTLMALAYVSSYLFQLRKLN